MNIGFHHLSARARSTPGLEEFPHEKGFRRFYDYFMYCVGISAPIALLPQVTHIYVSRSVAGISVTSWILLSLINFFWVLYAWMHREYPILISNMGMMILNLSVVVGVFLFH